jgi:hypothetical protein
VLLVSGASKLLDPADTAQAMRGMGLPGSPARVRAGAALELGIAAAAITLSGHVPAAAVALSYLLFTGFVVLALVRHAPLRTCGCVAHLDLAPTPGHAVANAAAAAVALVVAIEGWPGLGDLVDADALDGLVLAGLGALGAAALLALATAVDPDAARDARR